MLSCHKRNYVDVPTNEVVGKSSRMENRFDVLILLLSYIKLFWNGCHQSKENLMSAILLSPNVRAPSLPNLPPLASIFFFFFNFSFHKF